MRQLFAALSVVWVSVLCPMTVTAQESSLRPVIMHEPVKAAVRGQPVTVLARVTHDGGQIKSVTLFYALSKDVAPFRTVMKSSGSSMYYGTIPADVLETTDRVSYYIEATDHLESTQETPWHTMRVREQGAPIPPSAAPEPAIPQPAGASDEKKAGPGFTTMAVIGGGAVAVVGGALLIGGGQDGGSNGSSDGVQVGDYDGSSTECFTLDGESPDCDIRSISIRIDADGKVSSSTLRPGELLEGVLRGRAFSLVATLDPATGSTGLVTYAGSVVEDRIIGDISGEAGTPEGPGIFSGTFSARKRE